MVPVSHDLALQVNLDLDCMLRTEVEALSGSYRQDIFDMAPGTGGLDGHSSG
jgi:hypothetical protein